MTRGGGGVHKRDVLYRWPHPCGFYMILELVHVHACSLIEGLTDNHFSLLPLLTNSITWEFCQVFQA